jgi:cardiolipin synthase
MAELDATLSFEPRVFLSQLEADLNQSQSSIDIEVYIWAKDHVAAEFFNILLKAAQRGVHVRLLVDGIGSLEWIRRGVKELHPNLQVRIYHKFLGLNTFVYPNKFSLLWGRLNRRDHRKVYIIDDKLAYIGSFNIIADTLRWGEAAVKIRGTEIEILKEMFEFTWERSKDFLSTFSGKEPAVIDRLLHSENIFTTQTFELRGRYREMFWDKLRRAKKRVWMVNPYFNPPLLLTKRLKEAAKNNVEVILVFSEIIDYPPLSWVARLHYQNLIQAGVHIYEHTPFFIHSKLALIDDEIIVGSGNLNHRSFYHDLELNVVLRDQENIYKFEKQFKTYLRNSRKMNDHVTFWHPVGERLLNFFKTWI